MLHYKIGININRPVDQVFEFMTQLDNIHQLMDEVVVSQRVTDGPVGLGTLMTESLKLGPAREDITWEITAFEENKLCTFEGDTSFGRTQVSYMFEQTKCGTRVTAEVRTQMKGLFLFLRPFIQFFHRRNRQKYLAKIKRTLESGLDGVDTGTV